MKRRPSKVGLPTYLEDIPVPSGVFEVNGNLISRKNPSMVSKSTGHSSINKANYKNESERIPRKCYGIHPHCSICGKCHTNRRTHYKGHL